MEDDVVEIVEEEEEEEQAPKKKQPAPAAAAPVKKKTTKKKASTTTTTGAVAAAKKKTKKTATTTTTTTTGGASVGTTEQLRLAHASAAQSSAEAGRALNLAVIKEYAADTATGVFTESFNKLLAKSNAWFRGLKPTGSVLFCHQSTYKAFMNNGGNEDDQICLFSIQNYAVKGVLFRDEDCQLNNGINLDVCVGAEEIDDLYSLSGFGTLLGIIGCDGADYNLEQYRFFLNHFTSTLFTYLRGLALHLKDTRPASIFVDTSVLDAVFATFVFKHKFGFTDDDE